MSNPFPSFVDTVIDFLYNSPNGKMRYGIGCGWLGRKGDLSDLPVGLSMLKAAYEAGFRYFDTAPTYGQSEVVVGHFITSIPRQSIFLATKTRMPPNPTPQKARDYVLANLESSLARLKTEVIDLYQIHDIDSLAAVLEPGGALDALLEARRNGVIRYIGMATRFHDILRAAARQGDFDSILTYADYCLTNQSAEGLIDEVFSLGIGVINATLLIGVANYGKDSQIEDELLRTALQFPLKNPHITINLTGPANVQQLHSSVKALSRPGN